MQNITPTRCFAILGLTLALATGGLAAGPAASVTKSSLWDYDFHSVVPLGADALRLEPSKKTVYLMACAEAADFEGLKRTEHDNQVTVLKPDGSPASEFPQSIDFRVTVSAKKRKLNAEDVEPYPVRASGSLNDYLLKL